MAWSKEGKKKLRDEGVTDTWAPDFLDRLRDKGFGSSPTPPPRPPTRRPPSSVQYDSQGRMVRPPVSNQSSSRAKAFDKATAAKRKANKPY